MLVQEVMKTAIGISKELSLKRASIIMSEKQVEILFIVDATEVIGVISERDLIGNFGSKKKVGDIMSRSVISIPPNEEVETARRLMLEKKMEMLPVVDARDGLVGVLSSNDLLDESATQTDHFLVE